MVDQAVAATGNVTLVLVVSYPPSRGGTQVAFWDAATGGNRITATDYAGTLKTWIMPASGTFDSTIWVSGGARYEIPSLILYAKGPNNTYSTTTSTIMVNRPGYVVLPNPVGTFSVSTRVANFPATAAGPATNFGYVVQYDIPAAGLPAFLPPGGKVVLVQELHDNQLFGNYATPSFDDDASLSYYKHKILPPYPTQSNQKFKDSPIADKPTIPERGLYLEHYRRGRLPGRHPRDEHLFGLHSWLCELHVVRQTGCRGACHMCPLKQQC